MRMHVILPGAMNRLLKSEMEEETYGVMKRLT